MTLFFLAAQLINWANLGVQPIGRVDHHFLSRIAGKRTFPEAGRWPRWAAKPLAIVASMRVGELALGHREVMQLMVRAACQDADEAKTTNVLHLTGVASGDRERRAVGNG